MPTVVHRRGQPLRRRQADEIEKLLRVVVMLGIIGFFLYQNYMSEPSARHSSASSWGVPASSREDALQEDSLPPPGYSIKGNISVTNGARLYHIPGMRDYDATVIDTSRGERWFRTEAEATASGWRKAGQ